MNFLSHNLFLIKRVAKLRQKIKYLFPRAWVGGKERSHSVCESSMCLICNEVQFVFKNIFQIIFHLKKYQINVFLGVLWRNNVKN
jgi:hypothetical protein